MIKLSLDESFCFDLLSITEVKLYKSKGEDIKKLLDQFGNYCDEIIAQIGLSLFEEIRFSSEYKNLYKTNLQLFELIDYCKTNEVEFKEADDMNYNRFKFKNEIQKKFFGKENTEIKLGY